jgi:hypothetical protein
MNQQPSAFGELVVFLRRRIAQSEIFYIFLDALDEFEPIERRALLDSLASLASGGPRLRVFLTSRGNLSGELRRRFPTIENVTMASVDVDSDIALYVEEALQERMRDKDLVVGELSLVEDIKQALIKHADGMYVTASPVTAFANGQGFFGSLS